MGEYTTIMARDGHEFQAWLAAAPGRPRGALVILQEIFGVNSHIRAVADGYAADGYTVIAPSLFDRVRRGIELGYSAAEMQEGAGYRSQLQPETTLKDVAAAQAVVKHSGRAAVIGYCWGGSIAYLCATQLPFAGAVVYYGKVSAYLEQKPRCPLLFHYGAQDPSIPAQEVERVRAARVPPAQLYVYEDAGHGFNREGSDSYRPAAAALARQRTLEFTARCLAGKGAPEEREAGP
ncbi:MAG: dienelactone hydrolase family protein [Gammaproteobacteria bacterium]|nr:dienelactone hydrolase family protein [Gammaproteobacteria bacterium]